MQKSPLQRCASRVRAACLRVLAAVAWLVCAAGVAWPAGADDGSDRYVLEPQGSSVTFDVDAFSHSRIRMRFQRMRAQLDGTQNGLDSGRVTVTIDAASVEASPRFLSAFIRGGGMLDASRYPEIRFVSTRFVRSAEGGGWLFGNLTIRDVTRPVMLLVTSGSSAGNPQHESELAFSAAGEVSRREFGLSAWSPVVGDAVRMTIRVAFVPGS